LKYVHVLTHLETYGNTKLLVIHTHNTQQLMHSFKGTGVAVITPFNQYGKIDEPSLVRVLNHLVAGEVDYLVALGTTGETPTLSVEEKHRILDVFYETVGEKRPIVIGVGGNHTQAVCDELKSYDNRYPVRGFLSVCPYYNRPSQEGLYQHFSRVAEQTDTPVILYNIPTRTGINLLPQTVVRLAHDHANIVAIKECSGNLSQGMDIIQHKPQQFMLLGGDDILSLPMLSIGAKGIISVLANATPKLYTQMVNASLQNDIFFTRKVFYKLEPLMRLCFKEGNPTGIKTLMSQLELCQPLTRLPIIQGSATLHEEIKKELVSLLADTSSLNS